MMLALSDMQGLWSRSLLVRQDATRDTTTWVAWLQGPTLFADLRQPVGRPSFASVRSLDDLTGEQVAWLAEQEGFSGRLEQDGEFFVWRRLLDFQPRTETADSGRLYFDGSIMVEEGRYVPYIEHWSRGSASTMPCAAARLRDEISGADGILVRVGSTFMYARAGASASLPAGTHLRDHVAGAASLAAARALIDCEISFGRITGSDWRIERSSLPYREGALLAPDLDTHRGSTADVAADGSEIRRAWEILESESDATVLGATAERVNDMPVHG